MEKTKFDKIVKSRLLTCQETLTRKNKEYASEEDRLHNFKAAGNARGQAPTTALDGMLMKHLVSVWDIIDKMEHERKYVPHADLIAEKIGDVINYLLLLEGLIDDRREDMK
jgi:hypothetical protein